MMIIKHITELSEGVMGKANKESGRSDGRTHLAMDDTNV